MLCGICSIVASIFPLIRIFLPVGPERLQMLNDSKIMMKWEEAIQNLIIRLDSKKSVRNSIKIIDVSDGSTLSIRLGHSLKFPSKSMGTDLDKKFQIFSVEAKTFSCLFSTALINSNALSDEISVVSSIDEAIQESMETEEELQDFDAIISECYYFQLASQPTWEAISFLYSRNSILHCSPDAIVTPCKARLMCAALYLPKLYWSHGLVGRYCFNFLFIL
jgi:hypothetical protein